MPVIMPSSPKLLSFIIMLTPLEYFASSIIADRNLGVMLSNPYIQTALFFINFDSEILSTYFEI